MEKTTPSQSKSRAPLDGIVDCSPKHSARQEITALLTAGASVSLVISFFMAFDYRHEFILGNFLFSWVLVTFFLACFAPIFPLLLFGNYYRIVLAVVWISLVFQARDRLTGIWVASVVIVGMLFATVGTYYIYRFMLSRLKPRLKYEEYDLKRIKSVEDHIRQKGLSERTLPDIEKIRSLGQLSEQSAKNTVLLVVDRTSVEGEKGSYEHFVEEIMPQLKGFLHLAAVRVCWTNLRNCETDLSGRLKQSGMTSTGWSLFERGEMKASRRIGILYTQNEFAISVADLLAGMVATGSAAT